ncbi:MAG: multiheme c-type cytochrome [Campylobacterota bacterium]|nr:multiheme c-type cytochrome [Campylobacterota bacterium]
MVRIVLGVVWLTGLLFGEAAPELNNKYSDSAKCKPCHTEKVHEWSDSWHSKSHYNNNEYLRKSIDYVGRKSRKSKNAIKIECAACHNPRIAVTKTGMDYEIMAAMKLDGGSAVNKALESDSLNEGINCLVCHSVDKIDEKADETVRGTHRLHWNPVGIMSGPIDDAKSPYHKTQSRDFFKEESNKLCFVCHANDRSQSGLLFANMEKEMGDSEKLCADCHMSPKKPGVASNLAIENNKPKKRMVREHGFVGAHTPSLWEGALTLSVAKKGNELLVTINNDNPHNLPSGFGARELIIDATYKSGQKSIASKTVSMTQKYTSKRGKPTIPHLAVEATKDISIPANGSRTVKFPWVEGTGVVNVELYYRLVNDEVHSILKLKEPIWSKKMFIDKRVFRP